MSSINIEAFQPDTVLRRLADNVVPEKYRKMVLISLVSSVVTAFLSYFLLMVNGYAGPDSIVEGVNLYGNFDWAISLGRWFLAYTERYAVNSAVIPFLIVIMYAILVGISAIALFRMMKIESTVCHILIPALFVSFPIVSMQFTYLYMAAYYAYAFFCAVIGIRLIRKRKIWAYLLSVVCFVTMMGSYQSYLCAVAALAAMMLTVDMLDGRKKKDALIDFGITAGIGFISAVLNMLIIRLTFSYENIAASSRVADFSVSEIFANFGFSFKYAFIWFFTYFLNDTVFSRNLFYIITLAVTLIAFICCVMKLIRDKKIANVILATIGFILIPQCMNLIQFLVPHNGVLNIMRYQYVMIFPFMIGLIKRCEFKLPNLIMKWAAYLAIFALVNVNILNANVTEMTLKLIYNETYTEASAMVQRVYEVEGYVPDETKVILASIIFGATTHREFQMFYEEASFSGGPIFWNSFLGLSVNRRNYFLNYLGVDFGRITEEEYNSVISTEEYQEMPSWPSDGSVKMINGIVVIKND